QYSQLAEHHQLVSTVSTGSVQLRGGKCMGVLCLVVVARQTLGATVKLPKALILSSGKQFLRALSRDDVGIALIVAPGEGIASPVQPVKVQDLRLNPSITQRQGSQQDRV